MFCLCRSQSNFRKVEKKILDDIMSEGKNYDNRIRPTGNKSFAIQAQNSKHHPGEYLFKKLKSYLFRQLIWKEMVQRNNLKRFLVKLEKVLLLPFVYQVNLYQWFNSIDWLILNCKQSFLCMSAFLFSPIYFFTNFVTSEVEKGKKKVREVKVNICFLSLSLFALLEHMCH